MNLFLLHGNQEAPLNEARISLEKHLLPGGRDSGEVIDIRPPANQPLTLEKALGEIITELGTVSFVEGTPRLVIVHELRDFTQGDKGSARAAAKERAKKADHVAALEQYLTGNLPGSENALIFIFNENDEKFKFVDKSSRLYQLVQRHGQIREFKEKRIDWQFEEALTKRDIPSAIALLREWDDRGGSARFRIVTTVDGFLQLLLQARLSIEARRDGVNAQNLFTGMRPSLDSAHQFKANAMRTLAMQIPLSRIRTALKELVDAQKAFFPSGDELVVHDGVETVERLVMGLLAQE